MNETKWLAWGNPASGLLRKTMPRRVAWPVAAALSLLVTIFAGCQAKSPEEASIVLSTVKAPNPEVENGWAYDRATLDLGNHKGVVVPDDARVERAGEAGRIEVFMEKSLNYGGHPPDPMSIRIQRKKMGCVHKIERDKVVVATYGEWNSNIEGGTSMKVLIRVPDGLLVGTRKGLSGPIRFRLRGGDPPNREKVVP